MLNLGAIVGGICASTLADRFGPKRVACAAFLLATLSLGILSQQVSSGLLYVAVAVAGLGSVGTQILINGYVAVHYPAVIRATALGWALGVGRAGAIVGPLFGGWVLAAGIGTEWNFYGSPFRQWLVRCSSRSFPVVEWMNVSSSAERHPSLPLAGSLPKSPPDERCRR